MLKTVQGIYKDGKIQLAEIPKDIHESTVLVTFLENKTRTWSNLILQHQGFADSITFESYRDELLPPDETIFSV
ncbi:hypothetical protein [Dolichospermum sp. UHCC 0259]|jgi:hypothetical protein|uniref:hypothetical protein n=1 Tax=Dolichospermum sp. UHCC 0259 TaxID=2590010 RepID=UPI001447F58F|nr:hypothetical protein [Dolichospermum sp. UHCC 0259]MTJ49441.1 hypothetical protein [Dolichospermum sp. UHCC 0259]